MSGSFEIFKEYVNPSVSLTIMVVGLAWNLTLLLIFFRHKEVRTPANTMILNLVVSDILNLGIGVPHRLIFHYPQTNPEGLPLCRVHTTMVLFLIWLSAMSVLALNIQRFCISVTNATFSSYFPLLYVLAVWSTSLLMVLPVFFWEGVYRFLCTVYSDAYPLKVIYWIYIVMFCLLLPTLMLTFNLLTARRLKRSTNTACCGQSQTARDRLRVRSARVVTSLAVVFVATNVPLWIWVLLTFNLGFDRSSTAMLVFEYVSKWLLFTNSMFNPMALYMASGKFRKLFRRYMFCSECAEQDKISTVTAITTSTSTSTSAAQYHK